ncbi:MAG: hypothetical protein M1457_00430 [bacterium]|nr:hypothetical protein [bacterium]
MAKRQSKCRIVCLEFKLQLDIEKHRYTKNREEHAKGRQGENRQCLIHWSSMQNLCAGAGNERLVVQWAAEKVTDTILFRVFSCAFVANTAFLEIMDSKLRSLAGVADDLPAGRENAIARITERDADDGIP